MRHDQFEENLSSYVDGTLDSAMAAAMDRHVGECPACAADLAEMRRVYALLASPALNVEPPPAYHDDVMRKVRLAQRAREKSPRGFLARLGWGWTTAGAVAVAALFVAIVLSVGSLGEGLTAGLRLRPSPVSLAQPKGRLSVSFANRPGAAEQPYSVAVQILAPGEGEWALLARPGSGLALPGETNPRGNREVWRGPLATGQTTRASVYVYGARTGGVATLDLWLQRADGVIAARETVFVPTPGTTGAALPVGGGSLRDALAGCARATGRPLAAPTEALDARVPSGNAALSVESVASGAGMRVLTAGEGYALAR